MIIHHLVHPVWHEQECVRTNVCAYECAYVQHIFITMQPNTAIYHQSYPALALHPCKLAYTHRHASVPSPARNGVTANMTKNERVQRKMIVYMKQPNFSQPLFDVHFRNWLTHTVVVARCSKQKSSSNKLTLGLQRKHHTGVAPSLTLLSQCQDLTRQPQEHVVAMADLLQGNTRYVKV